MGLSATAGGPAVPFGGGSTQTQECGACNTGICDTQVGITGAFIQACGDGSWTSVAFPFNTGGADVNLVTATHNTNTGVGDIHITAGTCAGPDTTNILATLCGAIEDLPSGVPVSHAFPTVATSATDPTWVIMVFNLSFSFDVKFDNSTRGTIGAAYANLNTGGSGNPEDWQDLQNFNFGACYCVILGLGDPPTGACCLVDETCAEITFDECADVGGLYNGDGVPCSEVACAKVCGDEDTGNCCEANDNRMCDDADCCTLICETVDPFCCDVLWDGFCAFMAVQLCTELCGCGGPDTGDCCTDTNNPACDDVDCCAAVCAINPFCCDVEWDEICASTAEELCFICQVPPNDDCADAIELGVPSLTMGWTLNSTEDPEAFDCGTSVDGPGVWYTVTGTGTAMTASFCFGDSGADYDTKLHVYTGDCGEFTCVTGNDDACPGALSEVNWCSDEGVTYSIFVSGGNAQTGIFDLWVDADDVPCSGRTLIIKQGACPAPLNVRNNGQGAVPMLLVGDVDFDASMVAPGSLQLSRCDGVGGAAFPQTAQVKDLNHPNLDDLGCGEGQVGCACNEEQSSDGISDVALNFKSGDMAAALELYNTAPGEVVSLILTGVWFDGTAFRAFEAFDCVLVVGGSAVPARSMDFGGTTHGWGTPQ